MNNRTYSTYTSDTTNNWTGAPTTVLSVPWISTEQTRPPLERLDERLSNLEETMAKQAARIEFLEARLDQMESDLDV